jgi:cytochrome P450
MPRSDGEFHSWGRKYSQLIQGQFETLRFIGVSPFIPKYTHELPQTLTIKGKDYVIPPCTYVNLQLPALHSLPEYWGSDSLVWRPDRWILSNDGVRGLEHERLLQPTAGTFLPWAGGPRVCPGKKFAQVEFVAVIGLLFWKNRVRPALEPGETFEESSKRLLALVEDSSWNVSMTMRHPERLKLVWEERDLK